MTCPTCSRDSVKVVGVGSAMCTACHARFVPFTSVLPLLAGAGVDPQMLRQLVVEQGIKRHNEPGGTAKLVTIRIRGVDLHLSPAHQVFWMAKDATVRLAGGTPAPEAVSNPPSGSATSMEHDPMAAIGLGGTGALSQQAYAGAKGGVAEHGLPQELHSDVGSLELAARPTRAPVSSSPGLGKLGDAGSGSGLGLPSSAPGTSIGGGFGREASAGIDSAPRATYGGTLAQLDNSWPSSPKTDAGGANYGGHDFADAAPQMTTPSVAVSSQSAFAAKTRSLPTGLFSLAFKLVLLLVVAGAGFLAFKEVRKRFSTEFHEVAWDYSVELPASNAPVYDRQSLNVGEIKVMTWSGDDNLVLITAWADVGLGADVFVKQAAVELLGPQFAVQGGGRQGALRFWTIATDVSTHENGVGKGRAWVDDEGRAFITAAVAPTQSAAEASVATQFVRSLEAGRTLPAKDDEE